MLQTLQTISKKTKALLVGVFGCFFACIFAGTVPCSAAGTGVGFPLQNPADTLITDNGFEPVVLQKGGWDHCPIRLPNGCLISTRGANFLITSTDGGKTWPAEGNIPVFNAETLPPEFNGKEPNVISFTVTSSGAWIALAYSPKSTGVRVVSSNDMWDKSLLEFSKDLSGGHIYFTRSTDQGKTWSPLTCIFAPDVCCVHIPRILLEAAPGVLLIPAQHGIRNPGRNGVTMLRSADDGRTWENTGFTFDLPNSWGHHDGILEPTMIPLNDTDKTLWMLFRTNLGYFYESRSTDQGKTWSPAVPTKIQASAAPGTLIRLSDNRILLVYNPLRASDGVTPAIMNDKHHQAVPSSWQRREIVLITSCNEGKTWSNPLVIGRIPGDTDSIGKWLSYASLWEFDGYLYIVTGQGGLQTRIPINKLP